MKSWDEHPPAGRGLDGVDDDADSHVGLAGEAGGRRQHEGDGAGSGIDGGDARCGGCADGQCGGLKKHRGLACDEAICRERVDVGGVGCEDWVAGADVGDRRGEGDGKGVATG
jgi:hypothetical protein